MDGMQIPTTDSNDQVDLNPYFIQDQINRKVQINPDRISQVIGFNAENLGSLANNVDKRKIVEALQTLIKNQKSVEKQSNEKSADNVKFKFRMRFKDEKTRESLLGSTSAQTSVHTVAKLQNDSKLPNRPNQYLTLPKTLMRAQCHNKFVDFGNPAATSSKLNQSVDSSASDNPDKFREIRDLHNSMERQRRIELGCLLDQVFSFYPSMGLLIKYVTQRGRVCLRVTPGHKRVKHKNVMHGGEGAQWSVL